MTNVSVHLGKDEWRVITKAHFTASDGFNRRRTALIPIIGSFLGRGIDSLPAPEAGGQVRPGHPHVIPDMIVPNGVTANLRMSPGVQFVATLVKESVNSETLISIVSGNVIGDGAARKA